MATHSSILAWKIPWTEKPGRLESTGSQRTQLSVCVYVCVCARAHTHTYKHTLACEVSEA